MPPKPVYELRVHAVILTNDGVPMASDGSSSDYPTFNREQIKNLIIGTNEVWKEAGIQLVFDPAIDVSLVSSTLLNHDELPGCDDSRKLMAAQLPGRVTIFFREFGDGNFSGGVFVAYHKNSVGDPYNLAHEFGHYLGLDHTFPEGPSYANAEEVRQKILNQFGPVPPKDSDVINFFDSDTGKVLDTPADPGTAIFEDVYQYEKGNFKAFQKVPNYVIIEVPFPAVGLKKYKFTPHIYNIMSYYPKGPGLDHLTEGQVKYVRNSLKTDLNKHLIDTTLFSLGGNIVGTPSVVSWGPGRLDITARGTDNNLYHKAVENGKWFPSDNPNDWDLLGHDIADSPAVVSWGPGRLDFVVRGTDGGIWRKAYENGKWFPSNNPMDWEYLGGNMVGVPSVVSWGPGRLDITARGADNNLYHKAVENGNWFPSNQADSWDVLGHDVADSPAVISWGPGRLTFVVRGTDGGIWHRGYEHGNWFPSNDPSKWYFLGGNFTGAPSAVSWGPDRLDITARGVDNRLYHKAYENGKWFPSDSPNLWDMLGHDIADSPAVIARRPGQLDFVVRGTDGGIWHKAYENGNWYPSNKPTEWFFLGGQITGAPTVTSWGPGRLDIFAQSPENTVVQKYWEGHYWMPWP